MANEPTIGPFRTFVSVAVPIDIANCDTDQIIPARFLRKALDDPDYARFLFHDLRFNAEGAETDFIFNASAYRGAGVLVSDKNWGCGSSRENAVTALVANGIRAVIAPSVADIHYNNCIQNGVLPVVLSDEDCATLRRQLRDGPGAEIAIDLETQTLTGPDQTSYAFEVDPFDKHRLLNGLDDIGFTQVHDQEITEFVNGYSARHSWAG